MKLTTQIILIGFSIFLIGAVFHFLIPISADGRYAIDVISGLFGTLFVLTGVGSAIINKLPVSPP